MSVVRDLKLSFERPAGTDANRDAHTVLYSTQDFNAVAVRILDYRVAVGDRNGAHVELGRVERQEQCQTIIDARIGIDDNGKGDGGGGKGRHPLG
jgi:hypothetical protein